MAQTTPQERESAMGEVEKVFVSHYRRPINRTTLWKTGFIKAMGWEVDPKAGMTITTLVMEDGSLIRGIAICSILDNFDRKRGRNISLGRAVKKIVDARRAAGGPGA